MRVLGVIGCAAMLAGCSATRSSGIIALGQEMFGTTVTSRDLAAAAEKGLTDATLFCNGQGRQTQLLRTQINPADYQLVFRCVGTAEPYAPVAAAPSIAGVPIPNRAAAAVPGGYPVTAAPILSYPAFPQAAGGFDPQASGSPFDPRPVGQRTRPYGGSPYLGTPYSGGGALIGDPQARLPEAPAQRFALPARPPTLAALAAAAPAGAVPYSPAPSYAPADPPARRSLLSRLFGREEAPPEPPPLPLGRAPQGYPGAGPVFAAETRVPSYEPLLRTPRARPLAQPAAPAQPGQAAPAFAAVPEPLRSPFAPDTADPRPTAGFGAAALPPVTGAAPLPPLVARPALDTEVPETLPRPAVVPALSGRPGAEGASATPPTGFWETRRY